MNTLNAVLRGALRYPHGEEHSAAPTDISGFVGLQPNDRQPLGAARSAEFQTPVVFAEVTDKAVFLKSNGEYRGFPDTMRLRKDGTDLRASENGQELANLGVSVAITVKIDQTTYLVLTPQLDAKTGNNKYWRLPGGYLNQGNHPLPESITMQCFEEMSDEIIPIRGGLITTPLRMEVGGEVPAAIGQVLKLPVSVDGSEMPDAGVYFDPRYHSAQVVLARKIDVSSLDGITLGFAEERLVGESLQPFFYQEMVRLVPLKSDGQLAFGDSNFLTSFIIKNGKLVESDSLQSEELSPAFRLMA